MSSFHNSVAANHQEERAKPAHSAFISVQMMKAKACAPAAETRRCRLPSNEFSHDFMMKMKRDDQSPSPNQPDLKEIMANFLSLAEEEPDQTEFAFD
jgi:hypothetical protein